MTEVLTITSSSTSLTVQGPDFDDADNDGNTTEIITDIFPVLGLSTQDLNQCP